MENDLELENSFKLFSKLENVFNNAPAVENLRVCQSVENMSN